MHIHLVLIEDEHIEGLYPFSIMHAAWELRCGPYRTVDAWRFYIEPQSYSFFGRTAQRDSFLARFPFYAQSVRDDIPENSIVITLSSALLPTKHLAEQLQSMAASGMSTLLLVDNVVMGVVCHSSTWKMMPQTWSYFRSIATDYATEPLQLITNHAHIQTPLLNHLWQSLDYIDQCTTEQLPNNCEQINESDARNAGVFVLSPQNIVVGNGASIAPSVVLDATNGPVIIDANVSVMPHATVIGPCYIGANSIIKVGAKIYPNTIIGEWCKIGGEVEHSIIHAYSNKQHEGFLGHSYLGEWVNLGADTNTSDLKNTYGSIKVTQRSKEINTGRMFLGLLCGDHSKSGINTMFNTGTICGIHANVFGAGYSPTEIPSYCWGAIHEQRVYALKMALSVARTVMKRRGKELLPEEEALMKMEFERIHPPA